MYYCGECGSAVGLMDASCKKCSAELFDKETYTRILEERRRKIKRKTRNQKIAAVVTGVILFLFFGVILLTFLGLMPLVCMEAIWVIACMGIYHAIHKRGEKKLIYADRGMSCRLKMPDAAPAHETGAKPAGEAGFPVGALGEASKLKMGKNLQKNMQAKDSINFLENEKTGKEEVWRCDNCDTENSIKDACCIVCGSWRE